MPDDGPPLTPCPQCPHEEHPYDCPRCGGTGRVPASDGRSRVTTEDVSEAYRAAAREMAWEERE